MKVEGLKFGNAIEQRGVEKVGNNMLVPPSRRIHQRRRQRYRHRQHPVDAHCALHRPSQINGRSHEPAA